MVHALHFVRMSLPPQWRNTPLRDIIETWDEVHALHLDSDPQQEPFMVAWRPIPEEKPRSYKLPRGQVEDPTPPRYTVKGLEEALKPFGYKAP